ncbi:MAG: FtsW/RodA/SpoVE family cell cycle protein [Cytophagales bacterium]|jgi:cell division protein FtsW|nr:FtsW/RodA/SpoVE family cell cycle protein [Cytophagales bacterium]
MDSKIKAFFQEHLKGDYKIWLIVFILNAFGLLIQFSAKAKLTMEGPFEPLSSFFKTLIILGISFYLMSYFSKSNYSRVAKFSDLALFLSWGLVLVAYVFGATKGGANRWVNLGPISFMPSDMVKLCLITSLAKDFSSKQADPESYNTVMFIRMLIKIGISCFLIMLSNFSTSVLIFLTSIILMFFGRVPAKQIIAIIVAVGVLAVTVVGLGIGQRAQTVKTRMENFVQRIGKNETKVNKAKNEDYQITNSLYAISTGAIHPKGPGKSQQRFILSQAESDFVYAIIIEEYGIVGGLAIPILFLIFMYRGAKAIQYSNKPFGGLLSAGLTFSIVFQAFINMLVAVDAGPVTGQPMPMISAGGTSLIFTAISIGLILAVSKDKDPEPVQTALA